VDVRKVEVLKALRLTTKTVEEVSFKVPRQKVEFFQVSRLGSDVLSGCLFFVFFLSLSLALVLASRR